MCLLHVNSIIFAFFFFFYTSFAVLLATAFGLWVDLVAYSQRILTSTLSFVVFSYFFFKLMTWSILKELRNCIRCIPLKWKR